MATLLLSVPPTTSTIATPSPSSEAVSSRSFTSSSMPEMSSRSRSSEATSSRRASPATPSTAGRRTDRSDGRDRLHHADGVLVADGVEQILDRTLGAGRAVALGERRDPERRGEHGDDAGDRDADAPPRTAAGRLGLDVGQLGRWAAARRVQAARLGRSGHVAHGSASRGSSTPAAATTATVPPTRPAVAPQSVEKGPSMSFTARSATASPVTPEQHSRQDGPLEHRGEHRRARRAGARSTRRRPRRGCTQPCRTSRSSAARTTW